MKKSLKLILTITLLTILTFIGITLNLTSMGNTDIDFNNRLIAGKDIAYYIVSGNEYTASIPQAVSKLRYPSGMWNPIVLTKTTVQKQSKMDIYQYSENDGNNAKTNVWINNNGTYENATGRMDSMDWLFGKVHINDRNMSAYDNELRSTIILHEMLHVYGCKDIENSSSVMYAYTPYVRKMTSDANAVLVQKYNY